jgi:hypothetical protein
MKINMNQTVVQMVEDGLLTFAQVQELINKNKRSQKKLAKKDRRTKVKEVVSANLEVLLAKPGSTVKHRTVWLSAGKEDYLRDEILDALRSLREDGILQNIRTSNNNFQVFWAYISQPAPSIFGTLDDIED